MDSKTSSVYTACIVGRAVHIGSKRGTMEYSAQAKAANPQHLTASWKLGMDGRRTVRARNRPRASKRVHAPAETLAQHTRRAALPQMRDDGRRGARGKLERL